MQVLIVKQDRQHIGQEVFAVRDSPEEGTTRKDRRKRNKIRTQEKMDAGGRYDPCDRGVFTCISWNSMHPSKTVTMKELEDYASQELINQIECINGSYVVMICDEQEQASDWYALADETDQAEMEALAEKADVQIRSQKISPPVIFIMYAIQFAICYGIVWGIWRLYGKFRIGKRKQHYRV